MIAVDEDGDGYALMLCSAVEVGVGMLELDCHMTKDGEVVVSHDEDLTRVSGQPVRISDTLFKVTAFTAPIDFIMFPACASKQAMCPCIQVSA